MNNLKAMPDERLKQILVDAHSKGATKEQLDVIVQQYEKKYGKVTKGPTKTGKKQSPGADSESLSASGNGNSSSESKKQFNPYADSQKRRNELERERIKEEQTRLRPGQEKVVETRDIPEITYRKNVEKKEKEVNQLQGNLNFIDRQEVLKEVKPIDYEGFQQEDYQPESEEEILKKKSKFLEKEFKYENVYFQNKIDSGVTFPNLESFGFSERDVLAYMNTQANHYVDLINKGIVGDKSEMDEQGRVISDMQTYRAMRNYVSDRQSYLWEKARANQNNPEVFQRVMEEYNSLPQKLESWAKENLPDFTLFQEQKADEAAKKYLDYKDGAILDPFVESMRGVGLGVINWASDTVASIADMVFGLDGVAESVRAKKEYGNAKYTNPLTSYVFETGKQVEQNGTNYLVTAEGRILDLETKLDVTNIASRLGIDVEELYADANKSQDEISSFSFRNSFVQGGQVVGFLIPQLLGTKGVGNLLGGSSNAMRAGGAITAGSMMYATTYEDTLATLREFNVDEETAKYYANEAGNSSAFVTAATSIFAYNPQALKAFQGSKSYKELVKEFVKVAQKDGVEVAKKNFTQQMFKVLGEASGEGVTEIVQENLEGFMQSVKAGEINVNLGKEILNQEYGIKDVVTNSVLAFSVSGLMAAVGSGRETYNSKEILELYSEVGRDIVATEQILGEYVRSGLINEAEKRKIYDKVKAYTENINKVPTDYPDEYKLQAIDLLDQKRKLETKKQNVDPAFHEEINEQIKQVDEKIKNIKPKPESKPNKKRESWGRNASTNERIEGDSSNEESSGPNVIEPKTKPGINLSEKTKSLIDKVKEGDTTIDDLIEKESDKLEFYKNTYGDTDARTTEQESIVNELMTYSEGAVDSTVDSTVDNLELKLVNGKPEVSHKNGNKVSEQQKRKAIRESVQTGLYDGIPRALDDAPTLNSDEEVSNYIADNSENPLEVAEEIKNVQSRNNSNEVSFEDVLLPHIRGGVKEESFIENSDKNNITPKIRGSYLNKNGKSLDVIAQDVEVEMYGDYNANAPRITEQDIVDFILANPSVVDYENGRKSNVQIALETKFTELTGLPATKQNIEAFVPKTEKKSNENVKPQSEVEATAKALKSVDIKSIKEIDTNTYELPTPKNINEAKEYAEGLLKKAGLKYDYSGQSDTNGISVYYYVDGVKVRFSDHSLSNKDRMTNEAQFYFGNQSDDLKQSILDIKQKRGDQNIEYGQFRTIKRKIDGKELKAYGLRENITPQSLAEAYHKAKADGSNPELVQAVENLLSSEPSAVSETAVTETAPVTQETPVTPVAPVPTTNPALADVESTAKALRGVGVNETSEVARLVSKNKIKIKSTNVKDVEKILNEKGNPKKGDVLNIGGTNWEVNKIEKRQIWDSSKKEFVNTDGYEIQIRNDKNGETYTIRTDNNKAFKGQELSVIEKLSNYEKQISEAYHKAKADGSNPELVEAVEELLGKPAKENVPPTVEQTVADEGGVTPEDEFPFSVATDTKPFEGKSKEEVTVEKLRAEYPDAIVVQSESELPKPIQKGIRSHKVEGKVKGVFYRGQVYMVADNIKNMGEARGTYRHERLGHKGVVEYLGDRLSEYATSIVENAKGGRKKKLIELAGRYGMPTDLSSLSSTQKRELGEEYIAHIAENSDRYPQAWNEIVMFVRKALKNFGIDLQVSDAEIRALIGKVEADVKQKVENQSKSQKDARFQVDANGEPMVLSRGEDFTGKDGEANFNRWKGDNELVEGSEIQDVKTGQPIVAKVYHGTTNEFYEFDASIKGNIEGHLGKVNYFTSDYQDASQNYLAEGADITGRIDRRSEEISNEIEYEYNNFDTDNDIKRFIDDKKLTVEDVSEVFGEKYSIIKAKYNSYKLAEVAAKKELLGGTNQVLELYVKLNNPVVLGNGATWFDALEIDEVYLEEATQEIAEEYDITEEEAKNDYEWEIRDRAVEKQGDSNKIVEALEEALDDNGYDSSLASDILGDNYYETEVDLNKIEESIRKSELSDNYDGELASSQVIADFFKKLGFDGIILTDVAQRFRNMGLSNSTSHIHVFDEYNNQIKLSDGSNTTFNPKTPDIRFQTTSSKPPKKSISEVLRDRFFSARDLTLGINDKEKLNKEVKRKAEEVWRLANRGFNVMFRSGGGLPTEFSEIVRQLGRDQSAILNKLSYESKQLKRVIAQATKGKTPAQFNEIGRWINAYMAGEDVDLSFMGQEALDQLDYFRARIDGVSNKILDVLNKKMAYWDSQLSGVNKNAELTKVVNSILSNNKTKEETKRSEINKALIEAGYSNSTALSYTSKIIARDKTAGLIKTIEDNKKKYVNRSYEAFHNPKYLKDLSTPYKKMRPHIQKRYDRAVNYLMSEEGYSKEDAKTEINDYISALVSSEDVGDFIMSSTGRANAPFLKKRKELPLAFRELLGEIKDPTHNYVRTVFGMSEYLAKLSYQEKMRDTLIKSKIGSYTPKDTNYVLFAGTSPEWSILHGMYVPKEFMEAMQDMADLAPVSGTLAKSYIMLTGFTKVSKTVWSPTTIFRNLYSGVLLGINSGHLFVMHPKHTLEAFHQAFGTSGSISSEIAKEFRDRLVTLGIIKDGVNSGEIRATLNDFKKPLERLVKPGKATTVVNAMNTLYAFGDDFYKVVGFLTERDRLIKSGMDATLAEIKAAERVRGGYPTYSYLPKGMKALRRFPILSTFVSFPYEVVRSTKNNILYAVEDFREGRTEMAMKRVAGLVVANVLPSALIAVANSLMGWDDDDEDAVRKMLPEYQRNSLLLFVSDERGEPTFIDMTSMVPSEVWMKPLGTLMGGRYDHETFIKQLGDASDELVAPYLSFDITTKTMLEVLQNQEINANSVFDLMDYNKTTGRSIRGDDKNGWEDAWAVINHYLKKAGPGVYNNISETLRSFEVLPSVVGEKTTPEGREYKPENAALAFFGIRATTLNYKQTLKYYGYSVSGRLSAVGGNARKEADKTTLRSDKTVNSTVEEMAKEYRKISKEAKDMIEVSRKLGISDGEIYTILTENSSVSKADAKALLSGGNIYIKPIHSSTIKTEMADRAVLDKNKKRGAEHQKIYIRNVGKINRRIQMENEKIGKENKKIIQANRPKK